MKYKIVMAIGAFAVIMNVTACVVNIVRGIGFMQSVGDFISLFAVCLAMYAFYRHNRSVKDYKEALALLKSENNAKFDYENNIGRYYVGELSDKFAVLKSCVPHYYVFVVRTFPFTEGDDASRKKARLRAYSLLNHLTDNGKLWRVEK